MIGRQVFCLVAADGSKTIFAYDHLPAEVRKRLAASPFNLCAACLYNNAGMKTWELMQAIDEMEHMVRRRERDDAKP